MSTHNVGPGRRTQRTVFSHRSSCFVCLQEKLSPTYNRCGMESGPGTFLRMKTILSSTIDKKKFTMFHSAAQQLMTSLVELKVNLS